MGRKMDIDVEDIISMTKRLNQLLAMETDYLRAQRTDKVKELQDEKMKLITGLEIQKTIIKHNPLVAHGFPLEKKLELKDISKQFEETLTENYHELMKLREVNRTIMSYIAAAVKDQLATRNGYGHKGSMPDPSFKDVPLAFTEDI